MKKINYYTQTPLWEWFIWFLVFLGSSIWMFATAGESSLILLALIHFFIAVGIAICIFMVLGGVEK